MVRIKDIGIITRWRDLGLWLLDDNSTLDVIEANHRNDVSTCCRVMFKTWLDKFPSATWNQLVAALRNVQMHTAANTISKLFQPGD